MKDFTFTLDYSGETRAVTKHWQFCVGSGHAALAHRCDYMEQLKLCHDELGIERVRFHGIFNDDMHVCERLSEYLPAVSKNKTKLYNFHQVAAIYDRLLKIGVKPFVELGFMPSALASGKKTVFYYKGNVTLPKNMEEWQEFIREFARFLINRYGKAEVETWYFEVWNEPNLSCFFKGDMQDYYRLYAATVRALKSVDENILVGGPATTCSKHLTEFLDYCKREGVSVDFVTTHQYPTDALGHALNKERLKQIKKLKNQPADSSMRGLLQPIFDNVNDFTPELKGYMTREAKRARSEVGDIPLFYTEWSISSNCVAAIHDTTRASSFLVKTVLDNQGIIDGSSYWTFSDIFEELFFFPDPFCGGFGLLTIDGIKKPAFWAMKLLSMLPDTRYILPVTDEDVEVAAFKGDNGNMYLMVYAQNFDESFKKHTARFKIQNAPEFKSAEVQRVNGKQGNPAVLWEEMGKPAVLSNEQYKKLQSAAQISSETLNFNKTADSTEFNIAIEDNEVILIELKK